MKNSELLCALKALVAREREVLTELLRHLREVEVRRLHLAQGYSSLFAFCTGELGYSEPEAQVRIQAMRLMRDLPQVEQRLEAGTLSLSVAARVQGACRRNKVERPEEILEAVDGLSARATDRKLAALFPEEKRREKARPIADGNTRIEFTASAQLMDKLTRLKELMAHRNYDGRFDLLFEELADLALEKFEPSAGEPELGEGTGPSPAGGTSEEMSAECANSQLADPQRQANSDAAVLSTSKVKPSRYIPKATRRSLPWKRGCAFPGCGSRYGLQIDHIVPYSRGGTNAPENLQLLCGAHNRYKSNGDWLSGSRNNHDAE